MKLSGSEQESVIVFAKGYLEPEDDMLKGKN
jgi:hypothetical protein